MKNLFYLALALLFSFSINSQTTPAGENISLDQQLSLVNQSSVTSGIIYERAVQIANLYNFNRTTTFNTANYPYFKQALLEMNKASNGTKFITVDALKNRIEPTAAPNEVDLAVLNTQFQVLNYNEDNPSAGGLTYNTATNKFAQIAGQVPFYTLNTTVIAPMKETVSGAAIIYKIRPDLFFQNGTKTIKTLKVNFGDGEDRNLITNSLLIPQNISVNYTTTGIKTSTFVVIYTDNSTITTYGKLFFMLNNSPNAKMESSCMGTDLFKEDKVIAADEPFTGYDGQTFKGQIEARIFYHKFPVAARTLLKPIIVIDGFDPGDVRKIEDCDCENDPACYLANSTTTAHTTVYANGMGISHTTYTTSFNAINHKSIEDNMDYIGLLPDGTTGPINFLDILRDAGYDVIVINNINYQVLDTANPVVTYTYWVPAVINPGGIGYINIPGHWVSITSPNIYHIDGGADYIERNAMTLVSFIQNYVRPQQSLAGGTDDLVMVGPSMGGQITRYALAYMEKKFAETSNPIWKHHTKLWVSLDSPHLGANIPLALQSCVWFMGDGNYAGSGSANETYSNVLNSTAAKQMNINNYEYSRTSGNPQNSPFFTHYYNNLNNNGVAGSNGFPVSNSSFRKIAIANGSLTGQKQGNDGEIFFHGKLIVTITDEVAGFLSNIPIIGPPLSIATAALGNFSLIGLEVKNRFEPSINQSNTIFEGTFY